MIADHKLLIRIISRWSPEKQAVPSALRSLIPVLAAHLRLGLGLRAAMHQRNFRELSYVARSGE